MVASSRAMLEAGILPISGGFLDQSSTWWRALGILSSEFHATRTRMMERKD